MTSHSSGLGTYLVAHRRFRPKPPADGILKYKKKKEKRKKKPPKSHHLSHHYPSVRIHPVARTDLEPPAAKGGGGAKKYQSACRSCGIGGKHHVVILT